MMAYYTALAWDCWLGTTKKKHSMVTRTFSTWEDGVWGRDFTETLVTKWSPREDLSRAQQRAPLSKKWSGEPSHISYYKKWYGPMRLRDCIYSTSHKTLPSQRFWVCSENSFWTLLDEISCNIHASPSDSTWFTRPFLPHERVGGVWGWYNSSMCAW